MNSPQIKFCGITRPEDYLFAVSLKSDYVGFIFYQNSPRVVSVDEVIEMTDISITSTDLPIKVGVFVNHPISFIVNAIEQIGLKVVQLHGDESVGYIKELKSAMKFSQVKVELWKVARLGEMEDFDSYLTSSISSFLEVVESFSESFLVDRILLERKSSKSYGGTGKNIDFDLLEECLRVYQLRQKEYLGNPIFKNANNIKKTDFVLAGGLKQENLMKLLSIWKKSTATYPGILDFNSGVESQPGKKSEEKMKKIIDLVRSLVFQKY